MNSARQIAVKNGDKFFLSTSPCKKGHIGKRRTNNSGCMICEKSKYTRLLPDFTPKRIAKMNGERYFRSGKDCVNGHQDPLRATINSTCCECVTVRRRAAGQVERSKTLAPRKYVKRIRKTVVKKKKEPKIKIYKEVRITEEEIKAETFDEMTKRIYAEDRKW
jgi:hypothetical protein